MMYWKITSQLGQVLGAYEASSARDAVRQMNADAGLPESELDRDDGLTVTRLSPEPCDGCGVEGYASDRPGELPGSLGPFVEVLCADADGRLVCDRCAASSDHPGRSRLRP